MERPLRKVGSIVKTASNNVGMEIFGKMNQDEIRAQIFTLINYEYAVNDKGKFHACEMGALKFSLTRGIIDAFHTFISPVPLPQGSYAEAKQHSSETHKIPIFGSWDWDDDYGGSLAVINDMASPASGIVFGVGTLAKNTALPGAKETTFNETNGCLNYVISKARDVPDLKLVPAEILAKLLLEKLEVCGKSEAPEMMAQYLQRDTHNFDAGIHCFYHASIEDCLRCARAAVFRFYFDLVDMLFSKRNFQTDVRLFRIPGHLAIGVQRAEAAASSNPNPTERKVEWKKDTEFGKQFGQMTKLPPATASKMRLKKITGPMRPADPITQGGRSKLAGDDNFTNVPKSKTAEPVKSLFTGTSQMESVMDRSGDQADEDYEMLDDSSEHENEGHDDPNAGGDLPIPNSTVSKVTVQSGSIPLVAAHGGAILGSSVSSVGSPTPLFWHGYFTGEYKHDESHKNPVPVVEQSMSAASASTNSCATGTIRKIIQPPHPSMLPPPPPEWLVPAPIMMGNQNSNYFNEYEVNNWETLGSQRPNRDHNSNVDQWP